MSIPNTFSARVSIIKMNVLPRVNFCSTMLPLAPPPDHWEKLHRLLCNYAWKGKRPRIKMSTLQRQKVSGGLGIPNFEHYFWASTLRPLSTWLNTGALVAWRPLEENLVKPHRLEDLIHSNIPLKMCKSKFGSLVSHLVATWRIVETYSKTHLKYHSHLPLFNNFDLCLGKHPISFPQWSDKGINTLSDITSNNTLRSFQDLKSHYNLPGTSFFFYLQIRSALRAYGVPWEKNWNVTQYKRFVYPPKVWFPISILTLPNVWKSLYKLIRFGAMIFQLHLPQSTGLQYGQR